MERFIENYDPEARDHESSAGDEFDLLIIGGGITGAALAYDAAARGLSVALVEKGDFGGATSAATSKLIHGGFRYLAHLEFGLVRESLRERRTLENIAPNFVYPIPCIITSYNKFFVDNVYAVRTAMIAYELLSFGKGGTWDSHKSIPSRRRLSVDDAIGLEPSIPTDGLKGAGMQYDCSSLCPERLTLAFLRSAVAHGAQISNYSRVESFQQSPDGRVLGAQVHDTLQDRSVEVRAKVTVNCGGPWADLVLGLLSGERTDKKLRRSEGIHLIVRNELVNSHLVGFPKRDGGHFFILPWRGHTLIGTTDSEWVGNPDEYRVTQESMMGLLDEVNATFGEGSVDMSDVLHAYGGLRPLVGDGNKGVRDSSRKYEIYDHSEDGFEGLITVEGGKYTTSRNLAENTMKVVSTKLNRDLGECTTDDHRLNGCEIDDVEAFIEQAKQGNPNHDPKTIDWLARQYGTHFSDILDLAKNDPSLTVPLDDDGEIGAQVVYAIRHEMARTLNDVILRRTGIGTLGYPGDDVIEQVATIAAEELGWDDDEREREIAISQAALRLPD